ncbi:S-layer homology domain-containing protein [Leptolyngbya sp. FACHB-671]|uniref:S-layer homology domain-containing protein n=1 Tax=Leptolyngbya sp. FACHB-671 TaxID=2692812 RepID=UPI0016840D02|nr:S-layer homology domain-containing protein [Leptolyngbya sp. FACHB-671]MBD2069144.1 S-layer homology domain-containing protein [Leptolyngbya sp. FACHB-671]
MTNSPPPPPGSTPPSGRPLGFDELISIVIAFLVLGTVFFWSTSRREQSFVLLDPQILPQQPDASEGDRQEEDSAEEVEPERLVPFGVVPGLEPQGGRQTNVVVIPVPAREAAESRRAVVPLDAREPSEDLDTPQAGGIVPLPVDPSPTATTPDALPVGEPIEFTDVPSDFWARPFISEMSARGIISGFDDGTFRPNQPITRAEFAAMLREAFGQEPDKRSAPTFGDVPADFWAASAIQKSYQIGYIEGYPGNVFQPTQQIPRVQALVALATGLGLNAPADSTGIEQTYQDAEQIPDYATGKIAAATESRLVVNHPNPQTLEPNQNATRAEVAAFIHQALVQSGRVEPVESQFIVQP